MKVTEDLEMHDPFPIGTEIGGPVVGTAFDSAMGGDSFLMSDFTSSDEMMDLLDFDITMPPLQPPVESDGRENDSQGSRTINRPSSKASMHAFDHTLADVNCQASPLDLSDILQSPLYPTSQSPEPLFGLEGLRQKDVKYASTPETTTVYPLQNRLTVLVFAHRCLDLPHFHLANVCRRSSHCTKRSRPKGPKIA